MADEPKKPAASKKKILGQSPLAWGLELGGAFLAYILYRAYKSRSTSTTGGGTATSLTGGGSVPVAITSTTRTVVATTPTTFSGYITKALATLKTLIATATFGDATAYNALSSWQNGQCVSHSGYAFLSAVIGKLGLPPDGINYPLSVCSTSTTKTPVPTPPATTKKTAPPKLATGTTDTITAIKRALGNTFKQLSTLTGENGGYGLGYHTGAVQALTGNVFQTIGGSLQTALSVVRSGESVFVMTAPGVVHEFTTASSLTAYEKAHATQTTTWRKLTPKQFSAA